MQITIDDKEIKEAIYDFVGKQGITITNKKLSIAMVAGRGPNGYSATVSINDASHTEEEEEEEEHIDTLEDELSTKELQVDDSLFPTD